MVTETSLPTRAVRRDRPRRWPAVLAVLLAVTPIVVATVRAVSDGWRPVSDDALVAIRAADVLSSHPPLVGQASSVSLVAPSPLNDPGPLQFDVLAIPVALFGQAAGVAIGTALVNIAAIAVIALVVWRRGRANAVVLAMVVVAALTWSMGSELLYDPWPPHVPLLPSLAVAFLAWGLAEADHVWLPVAVGIGSYIEQTHLTFGIVVPALIAVGMGFGVAQEVRRRRTGGAPQGMRWGVAFGLAVIVGVLAWSQPVIEQVTQPDGNLGRIVDAARHPPGAVIGGTGAVRLTATVLAEPPFWLRDSFTDTFRPADAPRGASANSVDDAGAMTFVPAVLVLVAVVGVLLALAVAAERRKRPDVRRLVVLALVALGIGLFTASRVTTAVVGLAPYQFRFLWPIAAFLTFTVAYGTAAVLPWARVPRARVVLPGVALGLVALLTVLNLPATPAGAGSQIESWSYPVVRDLERQLARADLPSKVYVDWSGTRYLEPFSAAIMAALRDRDVTFLTDDAFLLRHLGPEREYDGRNATARIVYRDGAVARQRRIGAFRRVAFHAGDGDRTTVGVFVGPVDATPPPWTVSDRSGA